MRAISATLAGTAAVLAPACAPAEAAPNLDGTAWQLIEIQSMDDAQGTTTVADPSKYTVMFGTDGRAAFQIDCNRGSSTWEARPGDSDTSGELTFGPIATTLMACPPPSLDQQVSTALAGVRSYLIEDGKLHLALLADAGILTWQPAD